MVRVKVCGVTTVDDAVGSVDLGAELVGLNFWRRSPRRCELSAARAIEETVCGRARVVGVFVDATAEEVRRVLGETGIGWAQLHGDEEPGVLEALLPGAYKALRVGTDGVDAIAARYGGEHLLLDASVPGMAGGTGRTFDWSHARALAGSRQLILAGGLTPENVAEAVRAVRPWAVDVARGVERAPGVKDLARVRAFVDAARSA